MTTIDVVVCTYNNAASLDGTLHALCAQRVPADVGWSVLVVDNNCTDETPEVVARHARHAPVPLRSVREPEQGLTPARARGVSETAGEWVAFVDDDCLLAEDWLAQAAAFARAHPSCGGFGGRVVLEWEAPPPDVVTRYTWAYAHQELGDEPRRVRSLAGAGLVVRRGALAECGWLEHRLLEDRVGERLISGGDVELTLRLGAGHELWYAPPCILRHRIAARRTTPRHLRALVRGLGTSKLLGDSMLWPGSFARWVVVAAAGSREWAAPAIRFAARAAAGRGGAGDAAVMWSFLRGWWAGIWRLLRMPPEERRALVGCAVPGRAYGGSGKPRASNRS